jgi:hypothetical protein
MVCAAQTPASWMTSSAQAMASVAVETAVIQIPAYR